MHKRSLTTVNRSPLTSAALVACALLAVPSSTPVRAQPAVNLVVVDVAVVAKGYRVSKLTGSAVVNDQNERIGTLDDLIVSHDDHKVLFAILQVGGFLGLGAHLVAVPFDSLVLDESGKITLPGATGDQLKKLPAFSYRTS